MNEENNGLSEEDTVFSSKRLDLHDSLVLIVLGVGCIYCLMIHYCCLLLLKFPIDGRMNRQVQKSLDIPRINRVRAIHMCFPMELFNLS